MTGIDISQTAIEIGKKKAHQAKVNVNFLAESFIDLRFIDEAFGFVFNMGCVHHVEVEEGTKFIVGVHRVLKEGGR